VDVVTEHGKPVATMLPYEVYTKIRDVLLLMKAQADVEAGRVISFPAGTKAEDALEAILGAQKQRHGARSSAQRAAS